MKLLKLIFAFALGDLLLFCSAAQGAVDSVTVLSSTSKILGGNSYLELGAMMNGVAPGGAYSVPITFLYPENPNVCNDAAIVDLNNNAGLLFSLFDGRGFFPPFTLGRVFMGDQFIGGKGYVYLSVQWEKFAIEHGVPGVIAAWSDGYQVIADAAWLVKNASTMLSGLVSSPPCSVDKSLGFGFSQAAWVLWNIYTHLETPGVIDPRFDGVLMGASGAICYDLSAPVHYIIDCQGTIPSGVTKAMVVNAESDVQLLDADAQRGESDDYRSYEIAGVSHLPTLTLGDLSPFGATRQNPIDSKPVFKAMMENLREWVTLGTPPPPSVQFGEIVGTHPYPAGGAPTLLGFATVAEFDRDSDGNILGGIRLPHMPTGAPLGRYNGLEENAPNFFLAQFAALGGTFERFTSEQLRQRFSTHGDYVSAVIMAAEYALQQRWILEEDNEFYAQRAAACLVGKKRDLTIQQLNTCMGF